MATDPDITTRPDSKLETEPVSNGHAAAPTRNGLHLLIAGCGIARLVAAISLKRGFQVTIVKVVTESSYVNLPQDVLPSHPLHPVKPFIRSVRHLILTATGRSRRPLSPNASRVICRLDLRSAIKQYSTPVENVRLYSHSIGDLLVKDLQHDLEAPLGAPFWQVHRADLHKVLLERAREMGMKFLMGG
jgi:hypothetical protein